MRLDSVTAEIRPRSDWEAVDLGFAMVRRSFWRCITVWWLAVAVPTALAVALLWQHPFVLLALFWWWKPAGSRMVLFELSRRLFGENPPWRSVWREIPRVWWRRFFYRFLWARLSPWMPVTLAVEDLEGLRGKTYRQRSSQIGRRGDGVVMWIYFLADLTSLWLGLALMGVLMMLLPSGSDGAWRDTFSQWDPQYPYEIPLVFARAMAGCVMVAMSLIDVFVIGAGFGVYINNRTWIEGWDVELAFKRLAQRLGKVAIVLLALCVLAGPGTAAESPQDTIREIKADKDFTVHTVTDRIPKSKPRTGSGGFDFSGLQVLAQILTVCVVVLLVGFLGWMIYRHRHMFRIGRRAGNDAKPMPSARVVMGMEVAPDSLPGDVPSAAWALWQQGRHNEALALLYRGSISRVIELARVEILESDTEGDCLRRVEGAGSPAHPEYFRGLTSLWIRLAYAGVVPADVEVDAHCRQWPFGGEGGKR